MLSRMCLGLCAGYFVSGLCYECGFGGFEFGLVWLFAYFGCLYVIDLCLFILAW